MLASGAGRRIAGRRVASRERGAFIFGRRDAHHECNDRRHHQKRGDGQQGQLEVAGRIAHQPDAPGADQAAERCESAAAAEQETAQADFGRLQTRLDKYRARIAERNKKEGKNYLSVYYIEADRYEIQ